MRAKLARYLGNPLVTYDGQSLGTVQRIYSNNGQGDSIIVVAIPVRINRRTRKPSLWKLVPLREPRETTDIPLVAPYNLRTIQTAPEFSKTPSLIDKPTSQRLSDHYSTRNHPIRIEDAPLHRTPSLRSIPDHFPQPSRSGNHDTYDDPTLGAPISGDIAFSTILPTFEWFRAAQIVGIGVQLTGHRTQLEDWKDDADELMLPRVAQMESGITPSLVGDTLTSLGLLNDLTPGYIDSHLSGPLWLQTYTNDQGIATDAAGTLLYVSLFSSFEIVRVAAASQLAWLENQYGEEVIETLARGCTSNSCTVQHLAANALYRIAPDHSALRNLNECETEQQDGRPGHTSIIVHGTWSRRNRWWTPDGDFFRYLKEEVSDDLFDKREYFRWEGRWKDTSRDGASADLISWTKSHRIRHFDIVYAHSHGANVVLNAAKFSDDPLRSKLLVLLHPAIVRRDEQDIEEILQNTGRIFSISSRFDMVVLADRSFRLFPKLHDQVRRYRIPAWLTHGAGIKVSTWKEHDLAGEVQYEKYMGEQAFNAIMRRLSSESLQEWLQRKARSFSEDSDPPKYPPWLKKDRRHA